MKTIQPTLQEKYDFICNQLKMTDIDYYEGDGLLQLKSSIYFQLNNVTVPESIDHAIINAIVY